jgi:hypothetical protein
VQALPSLHDVPSGASGLLHVPLAGSQVPATWHWSCATHGTGSAPVQVPERQVSLRVQASPSSQATPSGRAGFEHSPVRGLQVPASWH